MLMERSQGEWRCLFRRRGFSLRALIVVLPVLVVLPAIAWKFLPGGSSSTEEISEVNRVMAERGDFIHVTTERGNVESAENVEIRCEVQSLNTAGTRIIEVVPEGTTIEDGKEYLNLDPKTEKPLRDADGKLSKFRKDGQPLKPLVTLDSSSLENDKMKQDSAVNASLAALIQAQSVLDTANIACEEYFGESPAGRSPLSYVEAMGKAQGAGLGGLAKAPLAHFHVIRIEEGKYFLDKNALLSEIDVGQENLRRGRDTERYSEQLESRGYITKVQLEADRFARQKAEKDLDAAKKKLEVLENYTKRKMAVQLKADIDTAKAKCDAAKATYDLDKSKLDLINEQIEKCTIYAPQAGQVVYANQTDWRGGQEIIIEEGTQVRERQVIFRLPDPKRMQVKAKVNEAKVALVREGMPARICLDAFPDLELQGVVDKVNEYPAPGGWMSSTKEYDAFVRILDAPVILRPGYTAEVTILISQESNVLRVPVQAVLERGGFNYCAVLTDSGMETRKVKIGPSNDQLVIIREGLAEGEWIHRSVSSVKDKLDLPDVKDEEGPNKTMLAAAAAARAAGRGGNSAREIAKKGGPPAADKGMSSEMADQMFKKLDRDGDGKLREEELPEQMRPLFAVADANHDKFIDRAEWTAVARQFGDGLGRKRPSGPPGPPGMPGRIRGGGS
jgi:HlyD family secretion protein